MIASLNTIFIILHAPRICGFHLYAEAAKATERKPDRFRLPAIPKEAIRAAINHLIAAIGLPRNLVSGNILLYVGPRCGAHIGD
jgi:hypothetical protein